MINLFLDDFRQPKDVTWVYLPPVTWEIVKDYDSFVEIINEQGIPNIISYDCDLDYEHYQAYFELKHAYPLHYKKFKNKCGIDCAEYLLEICKKQGLPHPLWVIHSMNNYGRDYINNLIEKSLTKFQK